MIAASYERIHRSNLVGMGVLPLEFPEGQTWQSLGLSGEETYDIAGLDENLQPRSSITVTATANDGSAGSYTVEWDRAIPYLNGTKYLPCDL